jgi:hypothetical protein
MMMMMMMMIIIITLSEQGNEVSLGSKMRGISWLAELLLSSLEEHCYVRYRSNFVKLMRG